MPRGIKVDLQVYEKLCMVYEEKYSGKSENRKSESLIREIQNEFGEASIGNRTIQNFFNSDEIPNATLNTLNTLTKVLLKFDTYEEAVQLFSSEHAFELNSKEYQKYWHFICERCSYAKVPNKTAPISIKEKYVNVEILESLYSKRIKKSPDLAFKEIEDIDDIKLIDTNIPRKNIQDILCETKNSRFILFGGPGAGKTTFLKYLCLELAGNTKDNDFSLFTEPILPVFISLRELSHHIDFLERLPEQEQTKYRTSQLILGYMKEEFGNCFSNFESNFINLLKKGNCLIMFDALDEVYQNKLEIICRAIENFVRKFNRCKFIITARLGSSEFDFKNIGFNEYEIAEFNSLQVEKFAEKYFIEEDTPEEQKNLKYFITSYRNAKISKGRRFSFLEGIVRNPLLLTILCEIFKAGGGSFPSNKYDLYEKNVDILLYKWDQSRRISRGESLLSKNRKIDLLGRIAYEGLDQDEQITQWKSRHLKDIIVKYLEDIDPTQITLSDEDYEDLSAEQFDVQRKAKLQDAADLLLQNFEEDDGILVRKYEDVYEFRHITFQSYLAAEHLADFPWIRESKFVEEFKTKIDKRLIQQNWDNLLIFLVGRLRKSNILFEIIFERASRYQLDSGKVKKFIEWLHSITLSSGYTDLDASWRAFYLRMDLHTDLFIDRNSPGGDMSDCRSIADKISEITRKLNIYFTNTTKGRTDKSKIELRLAAFHSIAVDLSSENHNEVEDFFQKHVIPDDVSKKSYQQAFDIKDINDIGLFMKRKIVKDINDTDRINDEKKSEFAASIEDLADEAIQISCKNKEAIKTWAKKLQLVINDILQIGQNIVFDPSDSKCLKDYLLATNIVLDCLSSDVYIDKQLRHAIFSSLFLPHNLAMQKVSNILS